MVSTQEVTQRLETLVSEELKSISYKWLAREFGIPVNQAKQILFSFADSHRKKVHATYLLAGWTKESTKEHVFKLVDASHLQEEKAGMEVVTSLHVHSVQPSQPKDPADLWNTDNEQAAALFERMVKQVESNCLSENKISAVCCQEAKRDPAAAPKQQPAPAAAQPVKPPKANGAAAKIDSIMKDSSAKAAAKKTAEKEVHATGSASAPPATAAKKPLAAASKTKAGGKLGQAHDAAPTKKQKTDAFQNLRASAPAAVSQAPVQVDSDSEEEEVVAPKARGGKTAVLDDSDSDAGDMETDASPEESSQVEVAAEAQAVPEGGASKAAEGEKGRKGAAKEPKTKEPKAQGKKATKRPTNQAQQGKVKAGAMAGVKRRKVTRTTINEKGEEVTETVWEDEDPAEEGDTSREVIAEAPQGQPEHSKGSKAASAAAKKPAPVKSSPPKAGKKSTKGGGAGQKSLMSFFNKK